MTKQEQYFNNVEEFLARLGYRLYYTTGLGTAEEERVYTTEYYRYTVSVKVKKGKLFIVSAVIGMVTISIGECSPISDKSHFRAMEGHILKILGKLLDSEKEEV